MLRARVFLARNAAQWKALCLPRPLACQCVRAGAQERLIDTYYSAADEVIPSVIRHKHGAILARMCAQRAVAPMSRWREGSGTHASRGFDIGRKEAGAQLS